MTGWSTAGTTRRALGTALLTGVLAAGAAGCGSSEDEATTSASAPKATATTAAPATETTATATDVTPDDASKGEDAMTTMTEPQATTAATPPMATTGTTPPTTATPAVKPSTAQAPRVPTRGSGSAADQAAVRQTVSRYMRAFVAGDGKTVCNLLSDRQRKLLGSRGAGSCEEATRAAQEAVGKDTPLRRTLEGLRVGTVSVTGDRAVGAAKVTTNGRSSTFPIELEHTADGWRIASNSPAGG